MFKRYSYQGGVCDPLVIHWPKGIKARGEVRGQYHHVTDIVPTILECCGVEFPETVNGYAQTPLPGVSMRYSFDDADAPTQRGPVLRDDGYARHLAQGLEGRAVHGPIIDMGNFDEDEWQLFHTDDDRSEAHDLAEQRIRTGCKELINLWFSEAEQVRRAAARRPQHRRQLAAVDVRGPRHRARAPTPTIPGTLEVPESAAANTHGRVVQDPGGGGARRRQCRGRDHGPGLPLRRPRPLHQGAASSTTSTTSSASAGAAVRLRGARPGQARARHGVRQGVGRASTASRTAPPGSTSTTRWSRRRRCAPRSGWFTLCGEGLCIGEDSGDTVSKEYGDGFKFTGGTIDQVEINVGERCLRGS